MKVKKLIQLLQKFDQDDEVTILIDESDEFSNIGFSIYVDLDGPIDTNGNMNKTLQINIGEHTAPVKPEIAIKSAKKLIDNDLNVDFLAVIEKSLL